MSSMFQAFTKDKKSFHPIHASDGDYQIITSDDGFMHLFDPKGKEIDMNMAPAEVRDEFRRIREMST